MDRGGGASLLSIRRCFVGGVSRAGGCGVDEDIERCVCRAGLVGDNGGTE